MSVDANASARLAACITILSTLVAAPAYRAEADETGATARSRFLLEALREQGVPPERVRGLDADGVPIVCADPAVAAPGVASPGDARAAALPANTRGWETVPGVIRADGVDSFRVEIDTNGPVAGVRIEPFPWLVKPAASPVEFRDDGLGGDAVAGDYVFTSSPFVYDTTKPFPEHYMNDAASPAGLAEASVGTVFIEELDATETQFLVGPRVGLLHADIASTPVVSLSADIVASAHLVNIRSTDHETQRLLRSQGGNISNLTNAIYAVLPDSFDQLVFFSTNKIESLPSNHSANFHAGKHASIQVNYEGTGLALQDGSAFYGSDGRLLGINVLDGYNRGNVGNNVTHEITHQWSAYVSIPEIKDGAAHYTNLSSAATLVGGNRWTDDGDGNFVVDCSEGRAGGSRASPVHLYMMGLIDASHVPDLHAYDGVAPISDKCNRGQPVLAAEVAATVTIGDIQKIHGVRTPGPEAAQRDFAIGFVAESHDRLLNPTEMTYYEILASHYTKAVPASAPDPHVGFNWAPVTRYFGERTTWRSDVLPGAGGEVHGLDPALKIGLCANRTTGRSAIFLLQGESAWDCRARGLDIEANDVIDMFIRGFAD